MPFNVTQQYDRAILDFGNVTNTGAVTNDVSEEVIIIEWDAVVIQNPLTDDTEDYWVSAGAEYNTETEIWVGQASFNLLTTLPVSICNYIGVTTIIHTLTHSHKMWLIF